MPTRSKATADHCCQRILWDDLDLAPIRSLIQLAKSEDLEGSGLKAKPLRSGDHSSALLPDVQSIAARLRAREPMTLCGARLAPEILAAYDSGLRFEPAAADGERLEKGALIGALSGPVRSALAAERPLLNFLQKLSGVATETRKYADALGGSRTRLLDTRKTTPGYRVLEKYAAACGGGWNHRIGLFDRVMLKDNHLAAFGSEPSEAAIAAVSASRASNPHLLVEMEVDRLDQIEIALAAQADVILLDNFSLEELRAARTLVGDRAVTEISGGVSLEALPMLRDLGHDFISTGATVHHSVWVDIGLDWK